jgi:imidazolonepropionase-like amidohydrolase
MGSADALGLKIKRFLRCGEGDLPAIRTCGAALYRKGTYGKFLGRAVSGGLEIRRAVERIAAEGADFVKVIQSGVVSLQYPGRVTAGGFSPEELALLVEEARQRRLPVHCHVNGAEAVRLAASIPVDSIEHGFFIDRETLHRLRENGSVWVPTVFALAHLEQGLDADRRTALRDIIDRHLEAVAYAASIGVALRVGTDSGAAGVAPGLSFFEELRLLKQAGLSLGQIVAAACQDPREADPGLHLLVRDDFIERGRIEGVLRSGPSPSGREKKSN